MGFTISDCSLHEVLKDVRQRVFCCFRTEERFKVLMQPPDEAGYHLEYAEKPSTSASLRTQPSSIRRLLLIRHLFDVFQRGESLFDVSVICVEH